MYMHVCIYILYIVAAYSVVVARAIGNREGPSSILGRASKRLENVSVSYI